MPRRNRVNPWGDLHGVESRGLFTGNRGCLVDDEGQLVRHHKGPLWIVCRTEYRDWQHPLDAPRTWTPLFFLDDAVALAAGHRPCGLCRRADYIAYRDGVAVAIRDDRTVSAQDLNRKLAGERHRRGRGTTRAQDRILWTGDIDALPRGAVVLDPETGEPLLITQDHVQPFTFDGWGPPTERPTGITLEVLTPPTSVAALTHAFTPRLHPTAR